MKPSIKEIMMCLEGITPSYQAAGDTTWRPKTGNVKTRAKRRKAVKKAHRR